MKLCVLLANLVVGSLVTRDSRPPHTDKAATARWLMNRTFWGSLSTISTLPALKGKPFSNIISFVEGFPGNSTGQPYFFVSDMDQSMVDLKKLNYASLAVSEAASGPCGDGTATNDPEDPRCVRFVLNGSWSKVPEGTQEWKLAQQNLFKHHPEMREWAKMGSHDFYVAKLQIEHLWEIDWFGGGYDMPLADYFAGTDSGSMSSLK